MSDDLILAKNDIVVYRSLDKAKGILGISDSDGTQKPISIKLGIQYKEITPFVEPTWYEKSPDGIKLINKAVKRLNRRKQIVQENSIREDLSEKGYYVYLQARVDCGLMWSCSMEKEDNELSDVVWWLGETASGTVILAPGHRTNYCLYNQPSSAHPAWWPSTFGSGKLLLEKLYNIHIPESAVTQYIEDIDKIKEEDEKVRYLIYYNFGDSLKERDGELINKNMSVDMLLRIDTVDIFPDMSESVRFPIILGSPIWVRELKSDLTVDKRSLERLFYNNVIFNN